MKKHTVRSLSRRAAALVLALALALPTVYAHAGEQKLQTSIDLVDGLTYRNTITDNSERRVESFSLELEKDSDAYPILLQAAGTVYGAATINRAVTYAQELGYHVLGAVNTDFFSTASGVPAANSVGLPSFSVASTAAPGWPRRARSTSHMLRI